MEYKTLTGSVVGGIIITILVMSGINITDNTFICVSTNQTCEANFGLSGGTHTRCYETQEQKDNWRSAPYCTDSWLRVKDYVKINDEINETNTQCVRII